MPEVEPPELITLRDTLMRLPGITAVSIQPISLYGLNVEDLRFSEMADLPSGTLRRTAGGHFGESLIQVWIAVDRSDGAWVTLEFLAWFIRDACRAGSIAQMRVRGLAPRVGDQVQVGRTLEFVIEWFVIHPDGHVQALLDRIREETASLMLLMDLYRDLIGVRS